MHHLILQLFDIGAIRFGSFTLKSGATSPIYLDLRSAISYPTLLTTIAEALYQKATSCRFTLVCGVPYTALPFATAISLRHNIPMILRRKEKKEYGTEKIVEGVFQRGESCLVIEDVITSGSSILETTLDLRKEGLLVEDAAILIDRQQGATKTLKKEGITIHAVLTLSQILDALLEAKKITKKAAEEVQTFYELF